MKHKLGPVNPQSKQKVIKLSLRKGLFDFDKKQKLFNVQEMVIRESPAAKRNKIPIGETLQRFLSENVTKSMSDNPRLLEIASGCGTHAMHFSDLFPHILWQPSDFQDESIESIKAHLALNLRSNICIEILLFFPK